MSGGHFDYNQSKIQYIIEQLEELIDQQGKLIPKEERYYPQDEDEEYYRNEVYSPEINEKLKEGLHNLNLAYIYAHRIDWFLSGDDSEESFLENLESDLKEYTDNLNK